MLYFSSKKRIILKDIFVRDIYINSVKMYFALGAADMKKKENTRKITLYLAIFIFLIVFTETIIYYKDNISNKLYLVLQGIMDGIRVFGFDTSIDVFDILEVESGNVGFMRSILNNVYILCYFLAPLITAKYIAQFVGYIVKEKLIDFNFSGKKKRILIIGYNDYVEKFLKNTLYSDKNKTTEKIKLLVLHKKDIPEKTKFRFQMSGVSFQKYEKLDYENRNDSKLFLNWIKPKKIKHIILFEEKGMDNVSNYCFLLKCFEQENNSGFEDGLKIDCNYNLSQVEELIWDCFDKKKLNLKYSMNTFSIPMLRAQSVLENTPIYNNVIGENGECKDIHLLIIGFGRMGRRFFKRAINESVVSEKNNIIVDIIEKDISKIKDYLGNVDISYYGSEENTIHINSDVVEGDLKIRFHAVDVKDKLLIECMESVSCSKPFTYIAICIDNPEAGVSCMLSVEDYLQRSKQNVPVLMRMDSGQQLKELESIYSNLKLVPGDDEILSMENIHSSELETISNEIHKNDSNEQKSKAAVAYQIESRKYRVLHFNAKKSVYEKLSDSEKEYMKEIFTSNEYTIDEQHKEFINRIDDNKLLFKLGAIEHRRWSYYMILTGWSYEIEKDENKMVTPYLCPFIEILSNIKLRKSAYYEYKDWSELIS